jgi:hypothetical protein
VGLPRAAIVGVVAACLAACGGSSSGLTRPVGVSSGLLGARSSSSPNGEVGGTSAPSGASSTTITVTTPTDCQAMPSGFGTLTWSTLGNVDDGNTYLMTGCQAILVEVLNSATDPCHWTTVQTTDSSVMTLLPIPLPGLPPPGGR